MVFQNYALYPHMTVAQNIALSLKLGKVPKNEIRERVQETARLLGLENLLDRRPKQLSGGQRQRVAMGRAIIRQPQVFLMDEPLSNLDAQLRVQMRGEIEALQKRLGVTTVYVTHDQVEALTMGDRIAVLREGVLQQIGTPAEVYDDPANLFVAGFIGSPPMNLAHARVEGGSVELGGARFPAPSRLDGQSVIVGIRPEDLYQARNGGPALAAQVDRVESVGASLLVHFPVDARDAKSAALAAATGGPVLEAVPLTGGADTSQFTATFEPRTMVRAGDTVQVALDPERLHFFDPETEASLRPDASLTPVQRP
jgi:multiple sugar transport system ATP-binding protein